MQVGRDFMIEEVSDLDAGWQDIEPLRAALAIYSAELRDVPRVSGWRERLRDEYPGGQDAVTVLARVKGKVIGFLCCDIVRQHLSYDEVFAYIDSAFVEENLRHAGVGRAMLERAEAAYRARGILQIRTTVDVTNELGIAAWKGLGFSPSSYNLTKPLEAAQ